MSGITRQMLRNEKYWMDDYSTIVKWVTKYYKAKEFAAWGKKNRERKGEWEWEKREREWMKERESVWVASFVENNLVHDFFSAELYKVSTW